MIMVSAIIALASMNVNAGEGHHISIHFEDTEAPECYLAYHFGNRQYMEDTTDIDAEGIAMFAGEERLAPGLYLVVLPDDRNFELLIDQNQHFTVHVDPDNFISTADFDHSPANTSFYEYLNFLRDKNREQRELEQALENASPDSPQQMQIQHQLRAMDQDVKAFQDRIIEEDPDGLLAHILKAQRDPDLPDPPRRPDGSEDVDAMYQIYKNQYFNNIDFADERLLYTPVYHSRLRIFFNNVLIQQPDTIIQEAERILEKASQNDEVFEYTLWFITNNADHSQMMGMDKVFVHMVDNYYTTDQVDWVDEQQLHNLKERADNKRPLLLGEKTPDVTLYDPNKDAVSLHDIDAEYLILYFWDSECPYCREAAPKLEETYNELRRHGVRVVAMNTDADQQKWLETIETYPDTWIHLHDIHNETTFMDDYDIYAIPQIFILNANHEILAKDIGVENVGRFIRENMQQNR